MTKINNDDIIKDSRGNIIRVGNKEYGYNNRGLIESYTKGEERYKYYYNYLGQRNKKERYKKEENEWKLKESKEYYLDEGIIIEESSGEEKLKCYYDKDGVSGIRYKGKNYELIRDILNNVREVVLNGKVIGEYLYDGWGNVEVRLTQGITKEEQYVIENNPYRYRGYYYDKESGLYYCITRYYSPELCIFTSIDSIEYLDCESINGLDLYCYCLNNPIMYVDPSGHLPEWAQWVLGGLIIIGGIALSVATGGLVAPLTAALGGGLMASIAAGAIVGALGGAVAGACFSIGSQAISSGFEDIQWSDVGKSALSGAISGAISGGIFGGVKYAVNTTRIANSLSGVNSAQVRLDNAFSSLKNVKNLSGLPFSGSNIARTVAQAATNYNSAYSSLVMAQINSKLIELAIKGGLSGLQFGLKQLIGY